MKAPGNVEPLASRSKPKRSRPWEVVSATAWRSGQESAAVPVRHCCLMPSMSRRWSETNKEYRRLQAFFRNRVPVITRHRFHTRRNARPWPGISLLGSLWGRRSVAAALAVRRRRRLFLLLQMLLLVGDVHLGLRLGWLDTRNHRDLLHIARDRIFQTDSVAVQRGAENLGKSRAVLRIGWREQ